MSVVEFSRATIAIGRRNVLVDNSFAIERGEFIGVLGPNGAGKTTLMRAILGLLPTAAGTVRVFGEAPRRGNPAIGYLPQVRATVPDLPLRGFDFIASSVGGDRRNGSGPPSVGGAIGRRAPTAAAGAGDTGRASASAARRAVDQSGLPLSRGRHQPGAPFCPRASHNRVVQRP